MKHRKPKLMAYLYMPLIFTILGYTLIYVAAHPVLEMLQAVGSMVVAKEIPDFNKDLKSIYNPDESKDLAQEAKDTISVKDIQFPDNGTRYGNLTCERIDLDAPVYWGDTNDILKVGVGHFMGSFLPGFNKSILLSAHNTTYFKPLQNIEVGDIITYNTNYGEYKYKVSEFEVVEASELNAKRNELLSYDKEQLMMYTCYPFKTLVGTKTQRLFIYADKISGPTVE